MYDIEVRSTKSEVLNMHNLTSLTEYFASALQRISHETGDTPATIAHRNCHIPLDAKIAYFLNAPSPRFLQFPSP